MGYRCDCNGFPVSGEGGIGGSAFDQAQIWKFRGATIHMLYFEGERNWWRVPQIFSKNWELQLRFGEKAYQKRLKRNATAT
jgi:hypothetical protein